MKKIKLLLCAFAMIGLATACSNDDDDADPVAYDGMSGTYNLTEVNTETATDFNTDGTYNINQKLESGCYTDSRMVFNADHSFTYYRNGISVDEANMTASCTTNTYNGTWNVYAGTTTTGIIEVTYMVNGNETSVQLNKSDNEITNYQLFTEYPNLDSNGAPIYSTGEVMMVFVKS